jgi:Spherulation-specific family 4
MGSRAKRLFPLMITFAALLMPIAVLGSPGAAASPKATLIVPSYVFPYGEVNGTFQLTGEWAALASTRPPAGGGYVVADVCDDAYAPANAPCGSGDVANPFYVNAINAVRSKGWTVMGYIDTGYGGYTCYGTTPGSANNACRADSLAYLQSEATAWHSFYGVNDFYFDDVCTGTSNQQNIGWGTAEGCSGTNPSGGAQDPAQFFKQLILSTNQGSSVDVVNPGTRPQDPAFLSSSEWSAFGVSVHVYVNVFEGCFSGAGTNGCPTGDSWRPGVNPVSYASATSGISMQVYAIPNLSDLTTVLSTAVLEGASLVYVTDESNAFGNPYSQVPSFFSNVLLATT